MSRRLGIAAFALVFASIAPLVADEPQETEAEQIQGLLKSVSQDLYMHDGYVYDSIVIVQGDFVCGGYINNSVVIAGENNKLSMMDGYVNKSVVAAGMIENGSYTSESLYSGEMVNRSSERVDLRNSRQFHAAPFYQRLAK